MSKTIYTGIAHTLRSLKEGGDDCICCKGAHIYSKGIIFEGDPDTVKHISMHGFISTALDVPDKHTLDGKRIRITFEVLDDPKATPTPRKDS